ncbi:MAG: enolase C-terminal domain-like protein [Gemmataceae bacterium]
MPSRRHFLAAGTSITAAACLARDADGAPSPPAVKIVRVETVPVVYPTVGRFKFFEDAQGRPTGRQTVLVKLTADDGSIGWGQAVPIHRWSYETLETVLTTIDRYLAPVLIGLNPFDVARAHQAMNRVIAPAFSTGQPMCKAGIDLALFDLTGRILKQTAAQRWGRKGRERLTLSWTLNPVKLDDVPRLIAAGRERGYKHFNIKVAPDLTFDIELARRVKKLVPDGFLWADANAGYDEATARQAVRKLADAGVAVLEQPLPPARLTGLQRLRKIGALPIILDESVVHHTELEEYVALRMLDGVAFKPAKVGGLTESLVQVGICEKNDLIRLGSGLTDPDLALAAALLLYGACDFTRPCALNGPQFLSGSVLKKPLTAENGEMAVPDGPGLGVEVDPDRVEQMRLKR